MDSRQLTERLKALEHDRAVQIEELDKKAKAIFADFPRLVTLWIENEIKSKVASNAANTERLKGEKLSSMKAEKNALLASLPKEISENIGTPDSWPHRNEKTLAHLAASSSNHLESYWSDTFRKCISHCGDLLGRYSYMEDVNTGTSPWRQIAKGKYSYVMGFSMGSPEITSYGAGLSAAVAKWEQIRDVKAQLARATATEAWDQA